MTATLHSIFIGLWYALLYSLLAPFTFLYAIGEWAQGRGQDVWWIHVREISGAVTEESTGRFAALCFMAPIFAVVDGVLVWQGLK